VRFLIAVCLLFPSFLFAQDRAAEMRKLAWQKGPLEARVADKATIKVPAGYVFLDDKNTSRFLELAGNPPRGGHYLFAPQSLDWWSVFKFDASGYVKDDEKIDPEALLKSLKEGDAPSNEERKKLGMKQIYTDGWQVPPYYDAESKRLEWGVRLRGEEGNMVVNYTSRLLGRTGVMSAILVGDIPTLSQDTQAFKAALKEFTYLPGEKYSEFKQGDKIAEYGLAALILGGAAAVATKKGFWGAIAAFLGAFWKVIAGVAVAGFAAFRGLFKKKT
jgi:uncharacterized membrane-anchored protein